MRANARRCAFSLSLAAIAARAAYTPSRCCACRRPGGRSDGSVEWCSYALEEVQAELAEKVLRLDVQTEQLVCDHEVAHRDQHRARGQLDRDVVALEEREAARRRVERHGG